MGSFVPTLMVAPQPSGSARINRSSDGVEEAPLCPMWEWAVSAERHQPLVAAMGANPHRGESEGQVGEGREDGAEGMEAKQK